MNSANRWLYCFATILFVLALGCRAQAPNVRVDHDQRIKLSDYRSFGWYQAPVAKSAAEASANAATAAANPLDTAKKDATQKVEESRATASLSLTDERLRSAASNHLQGKGYALNLESADVRINVQLNVTQRPKQSGMSLGLGAGGSSGNVGGGVGFSIPIGKRHESVAVMTIDVIDSARNTQVWTGTLQHVTKKSEIDSAEISMMVDTLLKPYPAQH